MKASNIKSYLRRYGLIGFIRFCLKVGIKKFFHIDFIENRYYVYDYKSPTNPKLVPVIDFRELTFQDFEKASKSPVNNLWFTKQKLEKIEKALQSGRNVAYGHFEGEELVCYGFMNLSIKGNRIGSYIFTENDVYLWDDYTASSYRGRGFHEQIILYRVLKAKVMGKSFAWSDVYPYNKASSHNFLKLGFKPIFDYRIIKMKNGKIHKKFHILNPNLLNRIS